MTSTYQMTEDAIYDAVIAFNEGFYPTPTAAAKAYNVAPRTVQRRVHRMGSRSSPSPSNRALNLEQEQAIRNYLKRLGDAGISATLSMLRGAANYLLKRSHLDPCAPPSYHLPLLALAIPQPQQRVFQEKTKTASY